MSGARDIDHPLASNVDKWIIDIGEALGYKHYERAKTGSICKVPERIREANKEKSEEWYRPRFVAIGPIHRGATIDLQTMELTKWRYADKLLCRLRPEEDPSPNDNLPPEEIQAQTTIYPQERMQAQTTIYPREDPSPNHNKFRVS
ncbi:hypothetical protein QN277_010557 [Acacia crassicarpa]|uniref:Uncharacterized protein n=1 Tax=Acacia crassicarpa TaxID=499986 RepID=A0AAE1ILZ3_9FABA|nr:hypothetical protein QN277_010557 [Acacia crassicarpa]